MNLERSILSNIAGNIIIKIAFLQFQHAFFWHIPMITVFIFLSTLLPFGRAHSMETKKIDLIQSVVVHKFNKPFRVFKNVTMLTSLFKRKRNRKLYKIAGS